MISIIIVNYRSWDYLSNCLKAIIGIENVDVLVVDNNSNDGLLESFNAQFPTVKWIESKQNLGFGRACNLGAMNSTREYQLFLNPDTIANEPAIQGMFDFLKINTEFKIVSCKQHQQIKKHFLLFPNLFRMFGLLRGLEVKLSKEKFKKKTLNNINFIEPDWVSGSVLMTTKTWLDTIKYWTTDFWMYSEDLEICKKTEIAGGKIALLTDVEIYHKHGGASRKNIEITAMAKAEVVKSKHVYIQKYFKGLQKYLAHLLLLFSCIFIKFPLAILGQILFFFPKIHLQKFIFINLTKYYHFAFKNKSWLSERAFELLGKNEN
jgi:GT2 family glycosyltransferase